jgi:GNAT superfamily N-acetyltransferase
LADARELAAIASLWKRERRTFTASFGGVSMLPTIAPGAPVNIVCGDDAAPGDVVLFLHRGQVVVHRLLARNATWMLTRGDANAIPDEAVSLDALVGRVIAAEPWQESVTQRVWRLLVANAFRVSPSLARIVVPALWQIRRVALGTFSVFARYGVAGVVARVWTKTFGRVLDVDVVFTLRVASAQPFAPLPPFRYERHASSSPRFDEAARLLRVDADKRREQEVFVAIDNSDETLAACTFNDRVAGNVAHQRGVAVLPRYRGRGLAVSVLQFQASALAAEGAAEVEYHVGATNRASRRTFAKLGARPIDRWIIVIVLRRFRFARRFVVRSATPN